MAFSVATAVIMSVLFLVPRISCAESIAVPDVLQAMERVLNFVTENPQEVYPDLPLGVQIAEAQLRILKTHLMASTYFSNAPAKDNEIILLQVAKLEKKCEEVVNTTRRNMKLQDRNYKKLVREILRPKLWDFAPEWRSLREHYTRALNGRRGRGPDEAGPVEAEEASDACLGQALGVGGPRCAASPNCSGAQTEQRGRGYVLTHQLLYVQVARQAGCQSLGTSDEVENLVEDLCSDILLEAEYIEHVEFPLYYRDLFCEQVTLCGMEGFLEFTKPEWISSIVNWQREEGCYGDERKHMHSLEAAKYNRVRHKRSEMAMAFGCLMHYTAVALAALAVGLRSLLEAAGGAASAAGARGGALAAQLSR